MPNHGWRLANRKSQVGEWSGKRPPGPLVGDGLHGASVLLPQLQSLRC